MFSKAEILGMDFRNILYAYERDDNRPARQGSLLHRNRVIFPLLKGQSIDIYIFKISNAVVGEQG
jgi:hypothetical protein